jgi:hypothetical protein
MKKLLFAASAFISSVTSLAQTRIYEQYASSVIAYSTQYNTGTYGAAQIVGKPNRFPACGGDSVWTTSTFNGQREFMVVGFAIPQPVNTVRIYQTKAPGSIDTVYIRNSSNGAWQTIYTATAAAVTCNAETRTGLLEIRIPATAYNVDALRFAVNSPTVDDYQEFDAVGIANFDYMLFQWQQYGSTLLTFSSQYGTTSWSAQQVIGPPNSGLCNDDSRAWCPLSADAQREFIAVSFAYPSKVNRVRIFQQYNVGAVDTIFLREASTGTWHKVFDTTGSIRPCPQQKIIEVNFTRTAYNVDAVRIALNSPATFGWNEIDAIEILSDLPGNAKFTTQNGNWSNTAIWSGGIVPGASDTVVIGHNVIADGNYSIKSMFIAQGGILRLDNAANSLTLGAAGGGKEYLIAQGTLSIINGNLNVNGNVEFQNGSTFSMTNGNITVDGNDGTSAGSVANETHLVEFSASMNNMSFTGGTMTIVDPQFHESGQAITGNYNFGPVTTFRLGNGTSNHPSGNPDGFGGSAPNPGFGHFIMDGNTSVGNRHFSNDDVVIVQGNCTISSGELRPTYTFTVNGNLLNNAIITNHHHFRVDNDVTNNATISTVSGSFSVRNDFINNNGASYIVTGAPYTSVGDDLINNGTFTTSSWLYMADNFGTSANEQTLGGTGSFSIYGLEPHNSHPNGVTLLLPLTIQSLYFSNEPGRLFIGNNDLTVQGVAYGSPDNDAYLVINGSGRLIMQNVTSERLFPVGTTNYTPVSIGNGNGHNFALSVRTGLTNPAVTISVVNREWNFTDLTGGAVNATLKFQWNAVDENAGFSRNSCYAGRYNGTAWNAVSPYAASDGADPYTRTVTNINSFSPFAIGSSGAFGPPLAPLPLHLVNFSAKKCNGNICLQWNTESEMNVSHYEIERSRDAVTFEKITSLAAQNRSSSQYNATDDKLNSKEVVYYRLKGVDIDGKITYSKIVKLNLGKTFTVFISPNPVKDKLHIQGAENFINILILDANGRLLRKMRPTSDNNYDTDFLQPGIYWIQLIGDKESQTHKLLKE